jgi:excisionase family DNA binding protein
MAEQPEGGELLTPGGVAALLFVDRTTVSRWALSGKLNFIFTPGGHRRFLKAEILAIRDDNFHHHEDAWQDAPMIPTSRAGAPRGPDHHPADVSDAAARAVVAEPVVITPAPTLGSV